MKLPVPSSAMSSPALQHTIPPLVAVGSTVSWLPAAATTSVSVPSSFTFTTCSPTCPTPNGSDIVMTWAKFTCGVNVSVSPVISPLLMPVPKVTVPRSGTGVATGVPLGAADSDAATGADTDGIGSIVGVGEAEGRAPTSDGSVGLRFAKNRPSRMAPMIVAITEPIEISDAGSVGTRPSGTEAATPCRNGTPHDRQTCAHSGFARPQLKHSTVSPVIGSWRLLGGDVRGRGAPESAPRASLACDEPPAVRTPTAR